MNIIIYPNNEARSESNPSVSMGTNEDYGIPANRPYKYKDVDGAEIYYHGKYRIKAFYNRRPEGCIETRGQRGIPKSDETKEKIRQAKIKRSMDDKHKRQQLKKKMINGVLSAYRGYDG